MACLSMNIFFRIQKNKCKEFPNGTNIAMRTVSKKLTFLLLNDEVSQLPT